MGQSYSLIIIIKLIQTFMEHTNKEPNKIIDGQRGEKIEVFDNKVVVKTTIPEQILPEKVEEVELYKDELIAEKEKVTASIEHLTLGLTRENERLSEINNKLEYFK